MNKSASKCFRRPPPGDIIVKALNGLLALTLILLASNIRVWGGATFKAGVEKVDITPPSGLSLWGYSDRKGPSTGVLDPLYARVLVLEASGQRLALVVVDLGRPFGPTSLERLRNATRNDVSLLIVSATHTHSGPVIQDEYPGGTPAWETASLEKIANAVEEACKHLANAQIGTGYGVAFIGHNRLRVNSDGTVSWFERNVTDELIQCQRRQEGERERINETVAQLAERLQRALEG